jgi:CRISPR-associated protein Cmr5
MNIERKRAEYALAAIERLPKTEGRCEGKKYTSYVKALPGTILQNGLGQALATLLAAAKGDPAMVDGKIKSAHRLLYDHIQEWLCRNNPAAPYPVPTANNDNNILMTKIPHGDEAAYIRAQAEALAYLAWLKKFATAFCPAEDKGTGENQ